MRAIALASLLFVAAAFPAHAQTAQQRYQGTLFITAANAACTASPTTASFGDNYVFVFRTEATKQVFAVFGTRRAMSYAAAPGPAGARFSTAGSYNGASIGGGASASTFNGAYSLFAIAPATFAVNTQTMTLKGQIDNFDGTPGCIVRFTAVSLRRPDF